MSSPTLYTIAPSRPFVDALAAGIWDQASHDPSTLATYHILLPTRRSCRSLREAFLRVGNGRPVLLPRMTPVGDVDEDELLLIDASVTENIGDSVGALPPAISALRRQLLLTEMIRKRPDKPSADQAALLAREMGGLIDQVATERLDFSDLKTLDVGGYAEHWHETLQFLDIVTDFWPKILEEENALDPAYRRNSLLEAQTRAWMHAPPASPVIAAGSTGSIPATADLLKVIAELGQGCVVLPGLDCDLDETTWQDLGPTHPQFGLKKLLDHMAIHRTDVLNWPETAYEGEGVSNPSRETLLRRALLPANQAGNLKIAHDLPDDALSGVTRIDCTDTAHEAECIALIMRETLEEQGKTASLVTPDRALARRVVSALKRWNIEIDDSAGVPLAQTAIGTFMLLNAEMIVTGLAPVPLLATLKHPLTAAGQNPGAFRHIVRRLETTILRGPRPEPGFAGLYNLPENITDHDLSLSVNTLESIATTFIGVMSEDAVQVRDALRAHIIFAESLAATDVQDGPNRLWSGEAGEVFARFVAELHDSLDAGIIIRPHEYPVLLETLMRGCVVRPRYGKHPRLSILGPLEARLQHASHIILGGLNEGVWPPEPPSSPWMSRPMMAAFGLPVPERRIGLSAHDFAQAFCASNVTLTRSQRTDGVPTVPSRWLRRLENLVSDTHLEQIFAPNSFWPALAATLDKPAASVPVAPPAPTPPQAARPRQLSVTRIPTLQRDPYAIYARYVLNLKPLESIDADPGAAERGTIIHDILEEFITAFPEDLPEDAEAHLVSMGHRAFENHIKHPGVATFWWPRFQRIAEWFVNDERNRRTSGEMPLDTEVEGSATFDAPGGEFRLTARADRINQLPGGGIAIIDYKTGRTPTARQAESGLEPQLPLEAAMVRHGRFQNLSAKDVRRLTYMRMTGGREAGSVHDLKLDVPEVSEDSWNGLQKLIRDYDNPDRPYLSHVRPMTRREVGDYDHLARVQEWLKTENDT